MRWRRHPAAVAGSIAAAALLCAPAPAPGAEAVAVQADPAHAGAAVEPGVDPPLRQRWHRRFARPPSYPVIAGGRVFVTVPAGRHDENGPSRIEALSARTGRTLWSRGLGGVFQRAAAAYDAGRVFVLSDDQVLRALSPVSGAVLWERAFGLGIGLADGPPVAAGGAVYAVVNHDVVAVDGRTGAVLWRAGINGTASCGVAVAGDRVYASFAGPHVYAFGRARGEPVWHVPSRIHGGGCETPAVHAGRLYVREIGLDPTGWVYDAGTGAGLGRFASSTEPAFARGLGLFLDARVPGELVRVEGTLFARDLRTGRARWRFRGDGFLQSAPLIVNRTVYVGSGAGRLFGLDLRTGRVRWRTHLSQGVSAPTWERDQTPKGLAAGGGVLVVPASRDLFAFE